MAVTVQPHRSGFSTDFSGALLSQCTYGNDTWEKTDQVCVSCSVDEEIELHDQNVSPTSQMSLLGASAWEEHC